MSLSGDKWAVTLLLRVWPENGKIWKKSILRFINFHHLLSKQAHMYCRHTILERQLTPKSLFYNARLCKQVLDFRSILVLKPDKSIMIACVLTSTNNAIIELLVKFCSYKKLQQWCYMAVWVSCQSGPAWPFLWLEHVAVVCCLITLMNSVHWWAAYCNVCVTMKFNF